MTNSYDIVVVGARCAGAPLATLLARAGLRVCLVDRARFPSDTPSTHAIQPVGVTILRRLGVLDQLLRVTTPIERGTLAFDDVRIDVDSVTEVLGAPMLNVRRVTLDALLIEAAATAGVDILTTTTVSGLVEEHGRVAGVGTHSGVLRAPLVIGADGVRSTIARLVGVTEYQRTTSGRIFLWAYFADATADTDRVWIGRIGDNGYLASSTDDGLHMVAVVPPADRAAEIRADRETAHRTALAGWPELHETMTGARQVGPARMMSRLDGFFRRSAGPGWALVGDAGHFKDPSPGQGIADALRQADALARVIPQALAAGPAATDRALHDWWTWRDRDAWEMYWLAHDMGAAGPTPLLVRELQRRIADDLELTRGLMRVLNHDLPPSKLFTPKLVLGAAGRALKRNRGRRGLLLREAAVLAGARLRHLRPPRLPAA
jgi:2-polyprenyl-6-methoxyphenol hydroxylase-like FAD-dependent oxidoreductase